MIQECNTKCFHVENEVLRIVLQGRECVVPLMEIKQGGARTNANHWEAVHQYQLIIIDHWCLKSLLL